MNTRRWTDSLKIKRKKKKDVKVDEQLDDADNIGGEEVIRDGRREKTP